MTELIEKLSGPPEKPNWRLIVAVALELGILTCIAKGLPSNASIVGLILCIPYAWFSATWSVLTYNH
jgi:hypothetical protein